MDRVTPAAKPKRERKRLQTPNPEVRRRLMDAAADLIREGGWNAVRIEDITERAALSVGTFYLYFEGKSDLFLNLVLDYTQRLRDRIGAAREEGDGPVAARLSRGFDAYLDFVLENEPGFVHYVQESGVLQTTDGPLSHWAFRQHAADLRPYIEDGIRNGDIRNTDPTLLSQAMVGLTQHMVLYWLEHRDEYSRAQIKSFLDMFIALGMAPLERRPNGRGQTGGRANPS